MTHAKNRSTLDDTKNIKITIVNVYCQKVTCLAKKKTVTTWANGRCPA